MSDLLNRKIVCKICGKEEHMRCFSHHLKSRHNVEYIEYVINNRVDFPNWKDCPICGNITKKERTCSRTCDKEFRKSQTGENSIRWGAKLSDKTKNKISISRKKQGNNWAIGKVLSNETKNKISKSMMKYFDNGGREKCRGKKHSVETIKKILSHRKMNGFEKRVANILDENGYKYIFQFFIIEKGVCKSYDFKIKGKPIIIEADGDFWHGNPKTKNHWKDIDLVKENDKLKNEMASNRGYDIIRIWESDFKKNPYLLIEKINKHIFI